MDTFLHIFMFLSNTPGICWEKVTWIVYIVERMLARLNIYLQTRIVIKKQEPDLLVSYIMNTNTHQILRASSVSFLTIIQGIFIPVVQYFPEYVIYQIHLDTLIGALLASFRTVLQLISFVYHNTYLNNEWHDTQPLARSCNDLLHILAQYFMFSSPFAHNYTYRIW